MKYADMTVSVDIPIPTCSIKINNKSNVVVRLGNLTPGMKGLVVGFFIVQKGNGGRNQFILLLME